MKKLLLILIMGMMAFNVACNTEDGDSDYFITGGGDEGLSVHDSEGRLLGYIVNHDYGGIEMLSIEGYFYRIDWDGTLLPSPIYFEYPDCSGTPYGSFFDLLYFNGYGKCLIYDHINNQLYTPGNIDSEGMIVLSYDINFVSYLSEFSSSCYSFYSPTSTPTSTPSFTSPGIKLEEIGRGTVGIPDTITPPLSFGK